MKPSLTKLILFGIAFSFLSGMACAQNVALSNKFAIFKSVVYNKNHIREHYLNLVPFKPSEPLKVSNSVFLHTSYVKVLIYRDIVITRSGRNIIAYTVDDSWRLVNAREFTVPPPKRRQVWYRHAKNWEFRVMFLDNNNLILLNKGQDYQIDLTKPIGAWRLSPIPPRGTIGTEANPIDDTWNWNSKGDWVKKEGTCVGDFPNVFCLMYGETHNWGGKTLDATTGELYGSLTFYHDKFLVKRHSGTDNVDSILYVSTDIESGGH